MTERKAFTLFNIDIISTLDDSHSRIVGLRLYSKKSAYFILTLIYYYYYYYYKKCILETAGFALATFFFNFFFISKRSHTLKSRLLFEMNL